MPFSRGSISIIDIISFIKGCCSECTYYVALKQKFQDFQERTERSDHPFKTFNGHVREFIYDYEILDIQILADMFQMSNADPCSFLDMSIRIKLVLCLYLLEHNDRHVRVEPM